MLSFEEVFTFEHLWKSHKIARRGKCHTNEVIAFEMDMISNIANLHRQLLADTYRQKPYYHFTIHEPKVREIYALHYPDRIVQHCLCDYFLAPYFETRLIYDNAACRKEKGTHFAINRLKGFLRAHYRNYGTKGYILKCDIKKFFDHIDHAVLRNKLKPICKDKRIASLIEQILCSYYVTAGKGLPLGNQTSQWFALWYLDEIDRYVKEIKQIKHYTRYMDDFILVHPSKAYLHEAKQDMEAILQNHLGLTFNAKTQIFPIKNGVEYLGWRFYLRNSGKVLMRLKKQTKVRMERRLRKLQRDYADGMIQVENIPPVINSYKTHLAHGDTWQIKMNLLSLNAKT